MSGIITIKRFAGDDFRGVLTMKHRPRNPNFLIERVDSHTWKNKEGYFVQSVSEALNVSLPDDEYETFSGFVFSEYWVTSRDGSTPEVEGWVLTLRYCK